SSSLKGVDDCFAKAGRLELEIDGELPEIEEILHSTVLLPELHHCLEFQCSHLYATTRIEIVLPDILRQDALRQECPPVFLHGHGDDLGKNPSQFGGIGRHEPHQVEVACW